LQFISKKSPEALSNTGVTCEILIKLKDRLVMYQLFRHNACRPYLKYIPFPFFISGPRYVGIFSPFLPYLTLLLHSPLSYQDMKRLLTMVAAFYPSPVSFDVLEQGRHSLNIDRPAQP
jgi:hypothetical protein